MEVEAYLLLSNSLIIALVLWLILKKLGENTDNRQQVLTNKQSDSSQEQIQISHDAKAGVSNKERSTEHGESDPLKGSDLIRLHRPHHAYSSNNSQEMLTEHDGNTLSQDPSQILPQEMDNANPPDGSTEMLRKHTLSQDPSQVLPQEQDHSSRSCKSTGMVAEYSRNTLPQDPRKSLPPEIHHVNQHGESTEVLTEYSRSTLPQDPSQSDLQEIHQTNQRGASTEMLTEYSRRALPQDLRQSHLQEMLTEYTRSVLPQDLRQSHLQGIHHTNKHGGSTEMLTEYSRSAFSQDPRQSHLQETHHTSQHGGSTEYSRTALPQDPLQSPERHHTNQRDEEVLAEYSRSALSKDPRQSYLQKTHHTIQRGGQVFTEYSRSALSRDPRQILPQDVHHANQRQEAHHANQYGRSTEMLTEYNQSASLQDPRKTLPQEIRYNNQRGGSTEMLTDYGRSALSQDPSRLLPQEMHHSNQRAGSVDMVRNQTTSRTSSYLGGELSNIREESGTNLDKAHVKTQKFDQLSLKLGIDQYGKGNKITVRDAMCVRSSHLTGNGEQSGMENFMAKLTSYDYRAQQIRFTTTSSKNLEGNSKKFGKSFDWATASSLKTKQENKEENFSSRDIIFVILNSLDCFLLQDVFMKLAACQMAVPLLLPNAAGNNVRMMLWGLRKISKSWCDDPFSSSITETVVIKHPLLYMAALRIGKFPMSKSNVLNKLLGPAQGYDDQSFFTSFEQDSYPAVLAEGTLECVWYLPGNEISSIRSPFGLLNLRGNALDLGAQAKFAMRLSFLTIVFLDASFLEQSKSYIKEIAKNSRVIAVCYQSSLQDDTPGERIYTVNEFDFPVTLLFTAGMSALEIGKEISRIAKNVLEIKGLSLERRLEECDDIAKELKFEVDEHDKNCQDAKKLALNISTMIDKSTPKKYKVDFFPFQQFWKEWSCNEKNRSWASSGKVEHDKAAQEDRQNKIRKKQASKDLTKNMKEMCDFLARDELRHYFLSWFQTYLNEVSAKVLKPLTKDLTTKSSTRRELSNKIHKLEGDLRNANGTPMENEINKIKDLKKTEEETKIEEEKLIKQFDDNALGFEHFVREFGQLVESKYYSKHVIASNSDYIDILPRVVAKMLFEGHPLEILDGEVSNVPLKWLKAVFRELDKFVPKNSKVYVISVLGIQSSGKSTLLNSMFGVRFAASAGRCTRGVFLQLLPLEKSLAVFLQCDFLAIVDTEGLRAPEKTIPSFTEQDNELATFALCISDLTLINIGGQTVGEDMMNVLQIASHAFVRMKEVDLNPECRIVQQFVADVTAEEKNESAMKAIVKKLDEAAYEAAKREGKEHLYRQFSDIFTLQNYETDAPNVQYIPSLWRGFMAAPDYQYSVRVQQLKSIILQSISKKAYTGLTLLEFQQRITDVWTAIQREDFVFNFQNAKEVSLYQEVMTFYRTLIQPIRQELLEMELSSKKIIACAKPSDIDISIATCLSDISSKLMLNCGDISTKLEEKFKEKRFEQVRKYSGYFHADLKTFQTHTENNIRLNLLRNADITKAQLKKSSVSESIIADLHKDFAEFAQQLRLEMEKKVTKGIRMENEDLEIEKSFKEKWENMLISVRKDHPLNPFEEIFSRIKKSVIDQILHEVAHTDFSKECIDLLKRDICMYSSASTNLSGAEIINLKLLFSEISNERNRAFEQFYFEIRELARDHQQFAKHSSKVVKLIEYQLEENFADSNWQMIIFFLCSMFVTVSHHSQQNEELIIIQQKRSILESFCTQEDIVPKDRIKYELKCLIENICLNKDSPLCNEYDSEALIREFRDQIRTFPNTSEGNVQKDSWRQRIYSWWQKVGSSRSAFQHFEKTIQDALVNLESRHDNKICKLGYMKMYITSVKNIVVKLQVPIIEALKLAYSYGVERFRDSFDTCLMMHIMQDTYEMKYANPLDYSSLQSKVVCMEEKLSRCPLKRFVINPALNLKNVWQFSSLSPIFSQLRMLDPCFINMMPKKKSLEIQSVIKIVNDVKNSILSHAKPKTDFNASSLLKTIGDLIQKTDHLSKKLQASAIIHIGAWVLPIYARCQFDYEQEKNLAYLIEKDEQIFEAEFKSLASNCQDELIAERCFDILKKAILEGVTDKLYASLYSKSMKHKEFSTKSTFIGYVLRNLFQEKNYHGIADLLHNFQNFSHNWILNFHAELYEAYPSDLESELENCLQNIFLKTEQSIKNTSNCFDEGNFSKWISKLTSTFEEKTKLACDRSKIETVGKYLAVKDFQVLSDCCLKLLHGFKDDHDLSGCLPECFTKESVKAWIIDVLPKPLQKDIFDSFKGCEKQCPFCGTVCNSHIIEHPKHESEGHFPKGLNGWRNKYSQKLVIDICNSVVESEALYKSPSKDIEYRPYKEYEKDFPDWRIRGAAESEPTLFWKRFFVLSNESLAEKFGCKPGTIPSAWEDITDEEAMESLCNAYNLQND